MAAMNTSDYYDELKIEMKTFTDKIKRTIDPIAIDEFVKYLKGDLHFKLIHIKKRYLLSNISCNKPMGQ